MVLVLLTGFTTFSFGEAFYGFTTGLYRLSEAYVKEYYGRDMDGVNFNFSITYFPEKSIFGVYSQTSLGVISSAYEWDNEDMLTLSSNVVYDFRFYLAPSLKLQLGEKLRIPVSLGPVFTIFREEGWSYYDDSDGGSFYEAIGMGVFVDAAFVFNPSRWFFLRSGVTAGWDFLRIERGHMISDLREADRTPFYGSVPYAAFYGTIYFGIGIRVY